MDKLKVVVASYLEPELVARIAAVDPRLEVVCEPSLLARPRYAADHVGAPHARTPEEDARWRAHLASADVLFDFDYTNLDALPELAPNVRWLQATSAGIGQLVERKAYAARMPRTVFTTASGVHAQPLAEFVALAMLAFSRGLFTMLAQQREKRWERFAGTDLLGKTALVYGYGSIGEEVARQTRALGVVCVGVNRSGRAPASSAELGVAVHPPAALRSLLPAASFLVLAAPHTPETERVIGAAELAMLPKGAIVINVSRGAVVDEPALVASLLSGHLGGAALDVFAEEPLPASSPLWAMPNVLVSPHSASTSDRENALLVDLFCENLRRFLAGAPLENVLDLSLLY